MPRALFFAPLLALSLAGCLGDGTNPTCRMTTLPGEGAYEICTVGRVITLERAGPAMGDPAMEMPAERGPVPKPVLEQIDDEDFSDGEPLVITSTNLAF
ncbi:hypothetical protein [Rhodobium gokarnense]|uniref:Lipoprotein n=1 Tax=Rhodobium gokarnense TaxID=364296 RepID=A0ABT3HA00_9HYPH|nr:hypothetical protein [Rhodobium gokarnense]MCW2307218.1 hypothetical protein [Rhodobium gokarnense]